MGQIQIDAELITTGSHEIRVWFGDKTPDVSDYDFVCVLRKIDDDTCEVALAMGDMNNDVNIILAIKSIELGYKHMKFYRTKGGKASRWATYTHSSKIYDYYEVDLVAAYSHYLEHGTI